jgi:hypothetical protein
VPVKFICEFQLFKQFINDYVPIATRILLHGASILAKDVLAIKNPEDGKDGETKSI